MPKIKTRKGAAKRFKITADGRVKMKHSYLGHILTKKTRKRKRNLRQTGYVASVDVPRVKKMLNAF